jgi:hypothetical protein
MLKKTTYVYYSSYWIPSKVAYKCLKNDLRNFVGPLAKAKASIELFGIFDVCQETWGG